MRTRTPDVPKGVGPVSDEPVVKEEVLGEETSIGCVEQTKIVALDFAVIAVVLL